MQNSISQRFNTVTLMKFVAPSVMMMVFISIYSMAGSIFAANYINEYALSAISIVFPFVSVVFAASIMFATGANAIISKNLGEGNVEKARQSFTVVTILAITTALFFTMIAIVFDDTILSILGVTENILPYAKTYLRGIAFSFPFLYLEILGQYFFVTIGKPTYGLLASIAGGTLNIAASFLFMGVLKVGVIGAAFGSIAANLITSMTFLTFFAFNKKYSLHFVKPKLHKRFIFDTCTNGSSEMVINIANAVISALLNRIMRDLVGDSGIAAVAVIVQVQFLLSSMFIGFCAGTAPIFGYAQGEDNRDQTKKVFWVSIKLVAISSAILVSLCLLFSGFIVGLFIDPASESFALAESGFILFSIGFILTGFNIFSSNFFTSVSNGKISALISFLRTFLFIFGMLMILPNIFGTTGVWLSTPIAEVLSFGVSFYLLRKYRNVYHY